MSYAAEHVDELLRCAVCLDRYCTFIIYSNWKFVTSLDYWLIKFLVWFKFIQLSFVDLRYSSPKILPCQHTVCKAPCLEGLIDRFVKILWYIFYSIEPWDFQVFSDCEMSSVSGRTFRASKRRRQLSDKHHHRRVSRSASFKQPTTATNHSANWY